MTFIRKILGRLGEDESVQFLKNSGYEILERNYQTRFGEVDVIAQDQGTICFVEVKTRQSLQAGLGQEAVSKLKQKKMIRVAQEYIMRRNIKNIGLRFDVLALQVKEGQRVSFELIKNAFEGGW